MAQSRRERTLHLLVEAFVESNHPVASRDLAERLGVSSATVRNDLVALEASGLLRQPHTSSGRVPTRDAYRMYAHQFLPPAPLDGASRSRLNHVLGLAQSEGRLRLAARLAASLSGYASVVAVTPRDARVQRLFLAQVAGEAILAVVVLEGGVTREVVFQAGFRAERATLDQLEAALAGSAVPVREAPRVLARLEESATPAVARVARALREAWSEVTPTLTFSEGTSGVLREPESQDPGFLRRLLELLERPPGPGSDPLGKLSIAVGDPEGISAVSAEFTVGASRGKVLVAGPVRMRYPRVIGVTQAIAEALTLAAMPVS
ncbi:MAG TPA: DeoR family transcriptional regulator [Deinococcales bacterium]|nr:DeoR family transcriptional regulator [Deinococcales bacterium]